MKSSSVDVVIPLYNSEEYIKETLLSIENQSVRPQKVIVVNDGSTDQSRTVVEKYMKESLMIIELINQKNLGRNAARNRGLKQSESEFVAFLDSDDVWHPNKLMRQMEICDKYPEIGLVYTDFFTINIVGETVNPSFLEANPTFNPLVGKGGDLLFKGNVILGSASSAVIKKRVFDDIGQFDESLHAFEDWDMWLRIAENHSFYFIAQPLVGIRKHAGNSQNNFDFMLENHLLFLVKWKKLLGANSVHYKELRKTILKKLGGTLLKGDLRNFFVILREMRRNHLFR